VDENIARNGGDSKFGVALHMHADSLAVGKAKAAGKVLTSEVAPAGGKAATAVVAAHTGVAKSGVPASGTPTLV
jgi:hypothetical protein